MSDGFEVEYEKALAAVSLRLTQAMVENARSGLKAVAIFVMPAMSFLKLTSTKEFPPESFINESQGLDDYNRYVATGKNTIMPFLRIKKETGRVVGHEGRHRAGALIKAAGRNAVFEVAMSVTTKDILRYYVEVRDPVTYVATKTYLGVADVPLVLKGEFMPRTKVAISAEGARELWK